MLTRDQLLAAPDLQRVEVTLPAMQGSVFVRELTHAEFAAFAASLEVKDGKPNDPLYGLKLLTRCLVDADGVRLLEDGDVAALGRWKVGALAPAITKASELNSLSEQAVAVEEKN